MTNKLQPPLPKLAFVYDRLNTRYGGAEYLIKLLLDAYPEAPIFTSVYHPQAKWVDESRVKTSFLQKISWMRTRHQWLVPLMPLAFESLKLDKYDIIISLTTAEAKGVLTKPGQLHISYIFSPPKYLYEFNERYQNSNFVLKFFYPVTNYVIRYLKWWDKQASLRPDLICTLSAITAKKIASQYNLTSTTVYPPLKPKIVKTAAATQLATLLQNKSLEEYLIVANRLVSYKRTELAIKVAQKLNKRILIVGTGNQLKHCADLYPNQTFVRQEGQNIVEVLHHSIQAQIIFLNQVDELELQLLFRFARAGLMLGDEDFGLVGAEMLNQGTPIVISRNSGLSELLAGQSGVAVVDTFKPDEIVEQINQLPIRATLDPQIQQRLSSEQFVKTWRSLIDREWRKHWRVCYTS